MTDEEEFSADAELEPLQEDSGLGSIQINNNVVANIVAMAAGEVPGVFGLASGDVLKGLFNKRDASVAVDEDGEGRYVIRVKLILIFGVRLAKVATDVQTAVRDAVENMTDKEVARVDVIVDAVRNPDSPSPLEAED